MLRYRLRTLLMLVTLACVMSAWVAYVRRMERFHREAENKHASRIAAAESALWPALSVPRDKHVEARVTALVVEGPRRNGRLEIHRRGIPGSRDVTVSNGRGLSIRGRGDITDWQMAVHHRIAADKYRRARFEPWVLMSRNSTP
jgi:hypothetical protein